MEPTPNFAAGLVEARKQLAAEGKLSKEDDAAVSTLLAKPVVKRPDGTKFRAMYRVHYRVRALYAKLKRVEGVVVVGNIDWTKIVSWIKEHWVEIIRIILTIIPFIV
jgi:hypothetical protein